MDDISRWGGDDGLFHWPWGKDEGLDDLDILYYSDASFESIMSLLEDWYKRGNKTAILMGIVTCIDFDQKIPEWCQDAFLDAFTEVRAFGAKSWDDVFGQPHKKGMNLDAARKARLFGHQVWARVEELKKDGDAVDGYLFERVGKEFGIGGKTLAETYYYQEKRRQKRIAKMQST
jgi:hypothetical protein